MVGVLAAGGGGAWWDAIQSITVNIRKKKRKKGDATTKRPVPACIATTLNNLEARWPDEGGRGGNDGTALRFGVADLSGGRVETRVGQECANQPVNERLMDGCCSRSRCFSFLFFSQKQAEFRVLWQSKGFQKE